jgi:hypothetical protein
MGDKMVGTCSTYKGEKYTEGFGVSLEGTRLLRRKRHGREYNIKMNLVEI